MRVVKELVAINHVIDALEYAGYSVYMSHEHYPLGFYHCGKDELTANYITTFCIELIGEDEDDCLEQYIGEAHCSAKDQFNRRDGAQIAFARTMRLFSENHSRVYTKSLVEDYQDYLDAEDD
jgi:hypothetical protein